MTTFTIYLMRDTVKKAGDAVVGGAAVHEIADGPSEYGTLFVKATTPDSPKWAKLFEAYVDRKKLGSVQSSSAAFLVPVDGRWFALTFGQGRFLLHPDAYEERFGLIVTLNSIEPDALRSVDKRRFVDDQNSRVQTNQAASALSFGVDIERDLIRGLVGKPVDEDLGRRMAGADALTVTTDAAVPDLKRFLRRYLKKFNSNAYQANFPWVDQVRQLDPRGHRAQELDTKLVEKLTEAWKHNGLADECWMALPDIIDWALVDGFKFTTSPKEGVSTDLHLPGVVQAYPDELPTVDFLKKHYAMSVDEDEKVLERWPLYRCMHCEMTTPDGSFVLSAGRWFEVDTDFVQAVDLAFQGMPAYPKPLPIYAHKDEDDYNKDAVDKGNGAWSLMDKKMLKVGGVYDKIEFCDLYGGHELIHVKHYGSSSVLGHLFSQGMVSGELLKSHAGYLDLANGQLGTAHQLVTTGATTDVPRDVSDYTIVFAIISQSQKPGLHLPFFAKVVLKSVCARLREWGYGNVMLAKIECDPMVALTKKVKPKKARKKRLVKKAA
ncbi:DUF6119 family protein [Dyella sp. 333MFSha]|uniref:DUF6119 family protein n=1 Tax=Dyella sp. 333MFSha TaxID=1798240 RepID=UPI000881ACAF|nr:DUF6119 family protein [Dyella sp. 333MFSha]SDF39378.1 sporadically distributed protein, TIGR04141 family [Dyella sp. 333MFSha]